MDPPASLSFAEKKRLCSLLLSTAGARFPTLAAGSYRPSGTTIASAMIATAPTVRTVTSNAFVRT